MRDMIELDNLEQITQMQNWLLAHCDTSKSCKNIALERFRLTLKDYTEYGFSEWVEYDHDFVNGSFHVKTAIYEYDCISADTPEGGMTSHIMNVKADPKTKQWLEEPGLVKSHETGELMPRHYCLTLIYMVIQNYICFHGMGNLFDVEERVVKQRGKKKGSGKQRKNAVRLYKCYRLKKDWENAPKLRKPAKITCPAWGVRGHMRHLKDGRIIYVRPCIKGKERDKYVGKEYKLLKEGAVP